jgi:REP element-mobilizing transposase RayT
MARPLRIEYDGALYHVTSRGNERKAIFKTDRDRKLFLDMLAQVNKRFHWICHAYCLITITITWSLKRRMEICPKGMRQLNGIYTQAYNKRHGRVGHLFQGRFKGILVQKDSHFLEVCRYVVLNSVRAKTTSQPQQYRWSSYQATA